jgi:hypothetical protein
MVEGGFLSWVDDKSLRIPKQNRTAFSTIFQLRVASICVSAAVPAS